MIAIYPLLLIWAFWAVWRRKQSHDLSWVDFGTWAVAGSIFTFSLLTGFSIGLFLLPLVGAALYLAVRFAPDFRASLGFVAGTGVSFFIVSSVNDFSNGWLIPGVVLVTAAAGSFAVAAQLEHCHRGSRA